MAVTVIRKQRGETATDVALCAKRLTSEGFNERARDTLDSIVGQLLEQVMAGCDTTRRTTGVEMSALESPSARIRVYVGDQHYSLDGHAVAYLLRTLAAQVNTAAMRPPCNHDGEEVVPASVLRDYKDLVRAESERIRHEMAWCDSGFNQVMTNLGLPTLEQQARLDR